MNSSSGIVSKIWFLIALPSRSVRGGRGIDDSTFLSGALTSGIAISHFLSGPLDAIWLGLTLRESCSHRRKFAHCGTRFSPIKNRRPLGGRLFSESGLSAKRGLQLLRPK